MGTKHTPAPWNIHFNETGHATSIRSDHHICVMRTNNLDECNANAKLIAAAPDLLEALEVCFASLCTYGQHPLIELRVKAAIKKATE